MDLFSNAAEKCRSPVSVPDGKAVMREKFTQEELACLCPELKAFLAFICGLVAFYGRREK